MSLLKKISRHRLHRLRGKFSYLLTCIGVLWAIGLITRALGLAPIGGIEPITTVMVGAVMVSALFMFGPAVPQRVTCSGLSC